MSSGRESIEAIPLMRQANGDDDELYDSHAANGALHPTKQRSFLSTGRTISSLSYVACLVAIISFAYNTLSFMNPSQGSKLNLLNENVVQSLRKPSLYLGIDRVPEIKKRLTVESVLAQSHTTTPDSSPNTPHTHNTPSGGSPTGSSDRVINVARVSSLYPDMTFMQDGWVILSNSDRAVVEFPTQPYSPRCTLTSAFPNRKSLGDKLLTIEVDDATYKFPQIQATLLSNSGGINMTSLTWNSRPATSKLVGQLTADFGRTSSTSEFACGGESNVLIELACLGEGCRVEFKPLGHDIESGSSFLRLVRLD